MSGESNKKLMFYKNKIKQALEELQHDIGELRYKLYIDMVEQCNDYDELKEMAELEMQIDSIVYTRHAIKDKLKERDIELKELKKICYQDNDIEEEDEIEANIDDSDTLALLAAQIQRRWSDEPPEETRGTISLDDSRLLTEEERIANMLIMADDEEQELKSIYGEDEDDELDTDDFLDNTDDEEHGDTNNLDELSNEMISYSQSGNNDEGSQENDDDFDIENMDLDDLGEYTEEDSDDEALDSEMNLENEDDESSLYDAFIEDEEDDADESEYTLSQGDIFVDEEDSIDKLISDMGDEDIFIEDEDEESDGENDGESDGFDLDNMDLDSVFGEDDEEDEEGDEEGEGEDELNPDDFFGGDEEEDEDNEEESDGLDLDNLDLDSLEEYADEDNESEEESDGMDLDNLDLDSLDGYEDESEEESNGVDLDNLDLDSLDGYEDEEDEEDEEDNEDEDESNGVDLDNLDLDSLEGYEDEEDEASDGLDLDNLDLDSLDGYEDEEEDEAESISVKPSPAPRKEEVKADKHITFKRGEHAQETQRTFDIMGNIQNKIGLFGKSAVKKTAKATQDKIKKSDYYKLPKEDE